MSGYAFEQPSGGFVFDNCRRNEVLMSNGIVPGKVRKTGTTIAALKYKDGVVIAADTRCTEGNVVFDDNALKIHRLSDNIYALGAGTAADCDFQTRLIESQLELLKLNQERQVRVATAVRVMQHSIYRYRGYLGGYFIVAGVDVTGSHVAELYADGTAVYIPFITLGSGGYTALSVIEDRFKENMSENDAKQLARDAIYASATTDLYSGGKINMFVITQDKLDKFLPYEVVAQRASKQLDYSLPKGTTPVLSMDVKKLQFDVVNEQVKKTNSVTHERMNVD